MVHQQYKLKDHECVACQNPDGGKHKSLQPQPVGLLYNYSPLAQSLHVVDRKATS